MLNTELTDRRLFPFTGSVPLKHHSLSQASFLICMMEIILLTAAKTEALCRCGWVCV